MPRRSAGQGGTRPAALRALARTFALRGSEVKRELRAAGSSAKPVAFAQVGVVGFDGQIELEAMRLYGLPEAAPALLCGTPALPVGTPSSRPRPRSTCRVWPRAPPTWWT
jgi:hypothetical protein